jgi:hypothetical protein
LAIAKRAFQPLVKVRAGNKKMRLAWKQGIKFTVTDVHVKKRPDSGAIKKASRGKPSKAEKLRKYRAMSTQIDSDELSQICKWCRSNKRAWGPTLLCELSRVTEKQVRKRIAKHAIEKRLGLVDLKRMVRL